MTPRGGEFATAMNDMTGLATFASLYGLVRYDSHVSAKYPRDGPCELGVCRLRRAEELKSERQARQKYRRRITTIRKYQSKPLSFDRAEQLAEEARDLELKWLPLIEKRIAELSGPPSGHAATIVFDHCHKHSWIRGRICMYCNNALIPIESGHHKVRTETDAILANYLANCPECQVDQDR